MPLQCTSGLISRSSRSTVALGKQDDVVHGAERGDQLRAGGAGQDRPARSLQRAHRVIVVDGDDQAIGFARGAVEVAHVADVQEVETAVGERDRAPGAAVGGDERDQFDIR